MLSRNLIIFLLLAGCVTVAQAKMYKWVDGEGVTQYTQTPPPNQEAEEVKPHYAPRSTSAEKQPMAKEKLADTESAEDAGPTKEEIAESEAIRKENCELAKQSVEMFENLGRKIVKTPDGLYKRYTEEERQAEIEKHKGFVKEYCGN